MGGWAGVNGGSRQTNKQAAGGQTRRRDNREREGGGGHPPHPRAAATNDNATQKNYLVTWFTRVGQLVLLVNMIMSSFWVVRKTKELALHPNPRIICCQGPRRFVFFLSQKGGGERDRERRGRGRGGQAGRQIGRQAGWQAGGQEGSRHLLLLSESNSRGSAQLLHTIYTLLLRISYSHSSCSYYFDSKT